MKYYTMKTSKADICIAANELLERQRVLAVLLVLSLTYGVLF